MIYQTIEPFLEAFGWMLIHSLWQGILIFTVLKVFLFISKDHSARFRYSLILTAMIAMGVWAMATLFGNIQDTSFLVNEYNGVINYSMSDADPEMTSSLTFSLANSSTWLPSIKSSLSLLSPWAVYIWLIGVILMGFRFTGNLFYLGQLRRRRSFPAGPDYQKILQTILNRTGFKREIVLRISKRISEPITFGFLKPVILLPASIISQIPPDQLEALILHELAHIHRHDYLVNIFQTAMEISFFYHPAIWWFSNKLREERELSCDDWAVEHGAEKNEYAQALIYLEKQKITLKNSLAMSAKGNKSSLTGRIYRLYEANSSSPSFSKGIFAFIILVFMFTGAMVYQKMNHSPLEMASDLVKIAKHETEFQNWKISPTDNGIKVYPKFGLYIINGKQGGEELLHKVTRTNLKSIDVLGPKAATEVYGSKGSQGAMLIDTYKDGPLIEGFKFMLPSENKVSFAFKMNRKEKVKVHIIDGHREIIEVFLNETLEKGEYTYDWDISKYSAGKYHLVLLANDLQHSFKLEKKDPKLAALKKEIQKLEEQYKKLEQDLNKAKAKPAIPGIKNLSTEMNIGENEEDLTLTIRFELEKAESVKFYIENPENGHIYSKILDKKLPIGAHKIIWDNKDKPKGSYQGILKTPQGETKLFSFDDSKKNDSKAENMPPPPPPPNEVIRISQSNNETSEPLIAAEVMPEFPGGNIALIRFFKENYNYPKEALEKGTEGVVYLRFVVNIDGSLSNIKVIKGIGAGCDKEALRLVSKMPKWIPGEQSNEKVAVYKTIPISFRLPE